MGTSETTPALPRICWDEELWRHVGSVYIRTDLAADRLARYGLTPQQIGATTIYLSAEDEPDELAIATGYDQETATVTLYPITKEKRLAEQNPQPRPSRRVPTGSRPEKYFEERSDELSGLLAGMLVHRAVDAGYRSDEMLRESTGHSIWRGGIYTVATGAAIYGAYKANESGVSDTTVGFFITLGGVSAVLGFAVWAGSESRRQEKEERGTITARYALEAYQNAPPDLVRVTPPRSR